MIDNNVKWDEPLWLSEKDELVITECIAKIVEEDRLKVYEYNICRDHMHILLSCEEEKLASIVGKLKAVSGRACNIERGITVPGMITKSGADKKYNPFWTQKFGKREITDEYDLNNVINYIKNNREKHKLPPNDRIREMVEEMCR